MSTKMKGLLKGLRYISQIFEEDKEPEMQIGFPTDVKHVAHIGWDGPSVHSPSWMGKFKATPEFSSAPLGLGMARDNSSNENAPIKRDSSQETTSRRATHVLESANRDSPEMPKTSRRHSPAESPVREKSEKSKTSRRQHSEGVSRHTKKEPQLQDPSLMLGSELPSQSPPDIPKKSRRKKPKDSSVGGSTRGTRTKRVSNNNKNNVSSSYEAPFSDPGPGPGSGLTSNYQTSTLQAFEEREEKKQGFEGVS